jgi:predicted Zn finger-like uncharacterized protein
MKFLCPNCKAKYQIADEKVGGRTLKMDCRRCKHTIVLRGDQPQAEDLAPSQPAPAPAPSPARSSSGGRPAPEAKGRGGSGLLHPPGARRPAAPARPAPPAPSPRAPLGRSPGMPTAGHVTSSGGAHGHGSSGPAAGTSALGADFRRSVVAGAPAAPESARMTPLDQWHVAINDVPVGPMRRDEIARKISANAVSGDSLAWREGFDDWRPLREIPELAALLRRSEMRTSERPGARGGPPPRPGATSSRGSTSAPRPSSARSVAPARPAVPAPAARSNVVPIGGRLGASAAPAFEEDDEPTRVASTLDLPSFEPAIEPDVSPDEAPVSVAPASASMRPRSQAPAAAAGAIPDPFASPAATASSSGTSSASVSEASPLRTRGPDRRAGIPVGAWIAIAGAMSFGVAMAVMVSARFFAPTAAMTPAVATTQPAATAPTPAPAEPELTIPEPAAPVAPVEPEHTEARPQQHGGAHTTKRTTPTTTTTPATGTATSDRFGRFADDTAGPAPILPRTGERTEGRPLRTGEGLEADQIRNVVSREQRGLQSCWEVAIRGMRSVPTVRMDVDITIGASGTVTQSTARGVGVGNLSECIERNVRRWRFPVSGDTSRTSFPVVFQGTG